MKYIRTKDEIIEEDKYYLRESAFREIDKMLGNEYKKETEIIKQADTIEELCDECIVYKYNDEKPINSDMKDYNIYLLLKETIINGMKSGINCWLKLGIWTSKGLIYVAKMNDKGCLELL